MTALAAIVVTGSLNMDFVVRVRSLPAPGETVLGRDFRMFPGGKGANQACAAAKLGGGRTVTRMIGCVGHDVFGDHLKASLAAAGVDVSAVHTTHSEATGIATIWVDEAGQNSIVVTAGANRTLAAADAESWRGMFRNARVAMFQLETPLDTVAGVLRIAREEGATTILDPAPARPLPDELLAVVDILTPNESEACVLLGREAAPVTLSEAPDLAHALMARGPRRVILKLGARGCLHADAGASLHLPAFPVEAVDTTAAGDTFNGALAVALAEDRPMAHALRFANAAAALSVTRAGAQASVPSRAEVDKLAG